MWHKTTDLLPVMDQSEYGWPNSKKVLVVASDAARPFVAVLEATDPDDPDCSVRWRSTCSDSWAYELEEVRHWMPIPPLDAATSAKKNVLTACKNPGCSVSTGIHDESWCCGHAVPGLTFGSGELDSNGYWSRPCLVCARAAEQRDNVPIGSYWPFPAKSNGDMCDGKTEEKRESRLP